MSFTPDIAPSTGAKIYIAPAATVAATLADYDALPAGTWTEISQVDEIPAFGATASTVKFTGLNGVVRKRKGSVDFGSFTLSMARVLLDPGQTMVSAAAADSKNTYPFMVLHNDAPAGGKATRQYFRAAVNSYTTEIGKADGTVMSKAQIEIDTVIVEGTPVAGS